MFDLSGKTALVTGATGGIGEQIARTLHAAGATVAISGRREDVLQKLANELGDRVHVIAASMDDAASIENLATVAEQKMGQVDILVNNAGLTKDGLFMRMKDEDWEQVINVNLTGAFRLTRAIIKGMMKRRNGRVINIASVVGVTGNPGQANYVASKAGLIGMTKSLAQEVASRGITINAIAPGFIATAMTEALNDDQKAKITQNIPSGRMGTADDIAAGVLYLSSNESAYVTGQTLHINGGLAMI